MGLKVLSPPRGIQQHYDPTDLPWEPVYDEPYSDHTSDRLEQLKTQCAAFSCWSVDAKQVIALSCSALHRRKMCSRRRRATAPTRSTAVLPCGEAMGFAGQADVELGNADTKSGGTGCGTSPIVVATPGR